MENTDNDKTEKFSFSFLGMKMECTNPKTNTMIVIALLLIFFAGLVFLLKVHILQLVAMEGSKKPLSSMRKGISSLIGMFKGKSP